MRAYLLGGFLAALALAPAGTAGFQLASLAPAQRHLPPALRACTRARPGLVALRAEVPQVNTHTHTHTHTRTHTHTVHAGDPAEIQVPEEAVPHLGCDD